MKPDKIRVYVDGVFDLTHYGHYKLFKQARELGDTLIVGVLSDEECRNYKRSPILTEKERTENIRCCGHVDEVIEGVLNVVTKDFIEKNVDIFSNLKPQPTQKEILEHELHKLEEKWQELLKDEKYELLNELKEIYEKIKKDYDKLK